MRSASKLVLTVAACLALGVGTATAAGGNVGGNAGDAKPPAGNSGGGGVAVTPPAAAGDPTCPSLVATQGGVPDPAQCPPAVPAPVFSVNQSTIHQFSIIGFLQNATVSSASCPALPPKPMGRHSGGRWPHDHHSLQFDRAIPGTTFAWADLFDATKVHRPRRRSLDCHFRSRVQASVLVLSSIPRPSSGSKEISLARSTLPVLSIFHSSRLIPDRAMLRASIIRMA